jgi:hypothetical protein
MYDNMDKDKIPEMYASKLMVASSSSDDDDLDCDVPNEIQYVAQKP